MKYVVFLFMVMISCSSTKDIRSQKTEVATVLDNWHKAAADANFDTYFDVMADESVFIGTDATENWDKKQFQVFAKPFFDKGKAWSFTAIERNIYFSENKKMAWFDELLNTQMKLCRGSGVLVFENGNWKIKHYVLSMTIPNENTNEVVQLKTKLEDLILAKHQ